MRWLSSNHTVNLNFLPFSAPRSSWLCSPWSPKLLALMPGCPQTSSGSPLPSPSHSVRLRGSYAFSLKSPRRLQPGLPGPGFPCRNWSSKVRLEKTGREDKRATDATGAWGPEGVWYLTRQQEKRRKPKLRARGLRAFWEAGATFTARHRGWLTEVMASTGRVALLVLCTYTRARG